MTASATAPTGEKAERAREDCEYVRSLLSLVALNRVPEADSGVASSLFNTDNSHI